MILLDSAKLLPLPLAQLAVSFGLTELMNSYFLCFNSADDVKQDEMRILLMY